MRNVKIIDDAISKGYQDWIEMIMTSNEFPWYFVGEGITSKDNPNDLTTGFFHHILKDGVSSQHFPMLLPLLFENANVENVYRIRAGMFVRNQNEQQHVKHIDDESKHTVMLYYVTDSDGPTQIYKGKERLDVEPKKGRAVIFPGEYYHNSSSPKNHKSRIVVNYNFI
jgi:uncharacterized protein YjcR|tara:strand:+ start:829 stop:1332 length:504 start_codon:yes stop_codon:yes gene_type:complete